MDKSLASLMNLSQSEADRLSTFTPDSPNIPESQNILIPTVSAKPDRIPKVNTDGVESPDELYLTESNPTRSYIDYQERMYSEVNTIYNAIDTLSGGQVGKIRSKTFILNLMSILMDGEINLKERMNKVWSNILNNYKIKLPNVDWDGIQWQDAASNIYVRLRNAFRNLRDYYYQIRTYNRESEGANFNANWIGDINDLKQNNPDQFEKVVGMLRDYKAIPTSEEMAEPLNDSYSAYSINFENTDKPDNSNTITSWSTLNEKVRDYIGDVIALSSESEKVPGNIIYGTQALKSDTLSKYASSSRPYYEPQRMPKGVSRTNNPLTLNDLKQNALAEGFAVGYKNFAGFEIGSDHDWRIKLKPYRSKGSGFGTWNRNLPSYNLPNLWKDKTSVNLNWSYDQNVTSWLNTATDRLYSKVMYGSEGIHDITAKDVADALIEAKDSNIRTFDFSEDTPVLTYNLNFGTPRTESMPLFNGSSMEVLTGMNYQVTMGMSILDDVYGSMFKYMVDYNNHVYNIENNEVAPYWLTAFEIDLLILRTGKVPKYQYRLIGVPIDFNPSHEGSDAPQECRINLTFGIIGMISANNNLIDANAPNYNRYDDTWNSIQIQLGNSNHDKQRVPHRDAVYRDLRDDEFTPFLTDEEKNKTTLQSYLTDNPPQTQGQGGTEGSQNGTNQTGNSEAEVKDPLEEFGWYSNLEPEGKKIVSTYASDILNTLFSKGCNFRTNVADLEYQGNNKVSMYSDNHTKLYDTSINNIDSRNENIIKASNNLVRVCKSTQDYILESICKCLLNFSIEKTAVNSQFNNLSRFITYYAHKIWIPEKDSTGGYPKKEGKTTGLTVEQLLSFQSSDWHGKFNLIDVYIYVRNFAQTYLDDPGSNDWKKLSRQDSMANIDTDAQLNAYFNMKREFDTSMVIGSQAYNEFLSKFK